MELSSNAQSAVRSLKNRTDKLVKELQSSLQDWGNATIKKGKRKKPYKRRSGNLDRAQRADVKGLSLTISIDPRLVTNNGVNYGVIQHDGSKHIQGEPWLSDAVDDNTKELEREIAEQVVRVFE